MDNHFVLGFEVETGCNFEEVEPDFEVETDYYFVEVKLEFEVGKHFGYFVVDMAE